MRNRFIAILSLFVIAASLIIISVQPITPKPATPLLEILPTPTPITWQTYKDEKYGFEFQYPSNWLVVEKDNIIYFHDPNKQFNTLKIYPNSRITKPIEKWLISEDLSVEYCSEESCRAGLPEYNGYKKIGNIDTETYTHFDEVSQSINYVLNKNKKYYEISFRSENQDNSISSIYDQILSTFKFLPDTSNWKTYTNNQYGFEFQYPNSYLNVQTTPLTYIQIMKQYNSAKYPKVCSKETTSADGFCEIYDLVYEDQFNIKNVPINYFIVNGNEPDIGYIYFRYKNNNYLIQLGLDTKKDISNILSTFKFTDNAVK